MVRAVNEVGYKPRMFGGAMIGLQFTPIKAQFGPLLNGIVINENYVPEPTMKFPGVDAFLKRYQERASAAGVDPLGYWSPFAYAEMQILAQAVTAVGSIDQGKIADYIHKTRFQHDHRRREVQPHRRMGKVANPDRAVPEHSGQRHQPVPPARQGRDHVSAGTEVRRVDPSLRQSTGPIAALRIVPRSWVGRSS